MAWISPFAKQIWVVATILLMMLGHGMVIGITSSMIPALKSPDSPIKVDLEQISWLSAAVGVGATLMYPGMIYFMAVYGRKGATIIGNIPAITGPLICYLFSDINVIIFGRFLSGAGVGAGIIGAIVIGEYTNPQYRGAFLNLKSAVLYVGSMVVHILGNTYHWKTVSLIILIMYMTAVVMVCTWPESPSWLVSQNRFSEGTMSFFGLRGKTEQSTRELKAMITAQKLLPFEADRTCFKNILLFLKKFTRRNFLKPLGVYMFLGILLEASGRHTFPAYALDILHKINPDHSNGFYYTLGVDLLMSISAIMSSVLAKLMRRRTLLFSSGLLSVLVILGVCLYYYLQTLSLISHTYDTVVLFLFGLYFGVVNLGCTPLCITFIGEIFPLEHRPTCVAVSGLLIGVLMTIILKVTPLMLEVIKVYGTFAVFGLIMAVCLLVLYFTLPETKDKTLQEIEEYFSDGRKKKTQNDDEEQTTLTIGDIEKIKPRYLS